MVRFYDNANIKVPLYICQQVLDPTFIPVRNSHRSQNTCVCKTDDWLSVTAWFDIITCTWRSERWQFRCKQKQNQANDRPSLETAVFQFLAIPICKKKKSWLPLLCKINYVNLQDNYVYMQDNYVYRQKNCVYMQNNTFDMKVTNLSKWSNFYITCSKMTF